MINANRLYTGVEKFFQIVARRLFTKLSALIMPASGRRKSSGSPP
jgi:hypothetical protein